MPAPAGEAFEIFSIHAPLAGSDDTIKMDMAAIIIFNPRSPRGERLRDINKLEAAIEFSIHAPLAGSDFLVD